MITTTDQTAAAAEPVDAFRRIAALTLEEHEPADFVARSFRAIAGHFASPYAAIAFRIGVRMIEDELAEVPDDVAAWRTHTQGMLLEVQSGGRCLARLYRDQRSAHRIATLAAPIDGASGEPNGAIVVHARCDDAAGAEALLSELRALCSLMSSLLPVLGRAAMPAAVESGTHHGTIVKAADYRSLHQLAYAITNTLRTRTGCDQVALGVPRRGSIRILSISGMSEVKPRSPGVHDITQAMCECLDRAHPILFQNDDAWNEGRMTVPYRLHRHWHEATGNAAVFSIPMMVGERCCAVLSLRRRNDRPFSRDEADRIRALVEPFAAALLVVEKASRSLPAHAADRVGSGLAWLVRPAGLGRKLLMTALLGLAAWVATGSATYAPSVRSVLAAGQVRQISAPFQGTLREVAVRPGDRVRAGDLLVALGTRELELERDQLQSEIAVRRIEVGMALAAGQRQEATLGDAELAVLEHRLAAVDGRIARARIVAPADGMVLRGDLRRRIGEVVPLGEPLLEFAPDDGRRLELLVPERLAADIRPELSGSFTSHARPGHRDAFTLGRINPAAEVRDGGNVVVATAELPDAPPWLRPGMEGAARIEVGDRPIWWLLTHRVVDAVRRRTWL